MAAQLDDPARAERLLTDAEAVPLTEEDRGALADDLSRAEDLRAQLRG